jgi:hypothetical protein
MFWIGLFLGSVLGYFVCALMVIAKSNDPAEED